MDCPKCYGRGRIVYDATHGLGGTIIPDVTHIELCDMCHGLGKLHGYEVGETDVVLAVGELADGTNVIMEVNPNGE